MSADKSPDLLPPGFEEKIKYSNGRKIKYYYNIETGRKYYSRKEVSRSLAKEDVSEGTPHTTGNVDNKDVSHDTPHTTGNVDNKDVSQDITGNVDNKLLDINMDPVSVEKNDSPEWLPHDWIVEEKPRRSGSRTGSTYKIYIDPSTGRRFLSKKTATEYLKTLENSGKSSVDKDVSQQQNSITDASLLATTTEQAVVQTVATDSTSVEGLPLGWTKEIRTSKSGNKIRKDPYYIDPVSGYEFRSKKDALRYLETNDIRSCSMKPKKRELGDLKLVETNGMIDDTGKTPSEQLDDTPKTLSEKKAAEKPISTSGASHLPKKRKWANVETVITNGAAVDGLPPGWTKETITRKFGNKKDPYFIDPVSGYAFHSKKDALRYLETNDIGSCSIRPKKREFYNFDSIEDHRILDDAGKFTLEQAVPQQETSVTVPQQETSITGTSRVTIKEKKAKDEASSAIVATDSTSVDGLPPGWIKEIRTSKSRNKIRKDAYYTDPASEYMFRSKKDALRYLETNDISSCSTRPKKKEVNGSEFNGKMVSPVKMVSPLVANDSPSVDGLPPGWTKEFSMSKSGNRKDPYYTDPVSGYMFRSRKDVFRYLETKDINSCSIRPKKKETNNPDSNEKQIPLDRVNGGEPSSKQDVSQPSKSMGADSTAKQSKEGAIVQPVKMITTERTSADGLPPGWVKEIRTSKSGDKIRTDPFYIDPVTGYMFRSKKDALRYLETNDIRSCSIKPKKKELEDPQFAKNEIPCENVDVDESSLDKLVSQLCSSVAQTEFTTEKQEKENVVITLNMTEFTTEKQEKENIETTAQTEFATQKQENEKENVQTSVNMTSIESTSAEGLPPGWIKEIRTSKSGNKIRKDPSFIDPVSGYRFRSKKDALRYLETNDIGSCTSKPKKTALDNLRSSTINIPSSSPASEDLSGQHDTAKELAVGGSNNESFYMAGEVSSRKRRMKTPKAKIPREPRKSKKKDASAMPTRTSRRCSEVKSVTATQGQTLQAEVGDIHTEAEKSSSFFTNASAAQIQTLEAVFGTTDIEADNPSSFSPNASADRGSQQHETEQTNEVKNCEDDVQETAPLSRGESPVASDQSLPPGFDLKPKQERDDQPGSPSVVDSWSDPCLEFAFRTLTAAPPVEDNPTFAGNVQKQSNAPYDQTDGCLGPKSDVTRTSSEAPRSPEDVHRIFLSEVPLQHHPEPFNQPPADAHRIFQSEVPPQPNPEPFKQPPADVHRMFQSEGPPQHHPEPFKQPPADVRNIFQSEGPSQHHPERFKQPPADVCSIFQNEVSPRHHPEPFKQPPADVRSIFQNEVLPQRHAEPYKQPPADVRSIFQNEVSPQRHPEPYKQPPADVRSIFQNEVPPQRHPEPYKQPPADSRSLFQNEVPPQRHPEPFKQYCADVRSIFQDEVPHQHHPEPFKQHPADVRSFFQNELPSQHHLEPFKQPPADVHSLFHNVPPQRHPEQFRQSPAFQQFFQNEVHQPRPGQFQPPAFQQFRGNLPFLNPTYNNYPTGSGANSEHERMKAEKKDDVTRSFF